MKKSRSIYLLYVLSQFALAGLVVAVIAAGVVSFIGDTTWGLPTFYKLESSLALGGVDTRAEIAFKQGYVELNNEVLSTTAKAGVVSGFLLLFGCIAYGIYCFNRFMKGVYHGHTFADETIGYLKKCAFALVAVSLTLFLLRISSHMYVTHILDMSSYRSHFEFGIIFNPYLMGALFLWVLAHIFQKGKELEDDQKLTI